MGTWDRIPILSDPRDRIGILSHSRNGIKESSYEQTTQDSSGTGFPAVACAAA